MSVIHADDPLKDLARSEPGLQTLLRRHHIDLRFVQDLTLLEVCAIHGINLGEMVRELEEMDRDSHFLSQDELEAFAVPELVGYILSTHHGYLRKELQRLEALLAEASRSDGASQPFLLELLDLFVDFKVSLEWHMREEEKHLFPYYLELAERSAAFPGRSQELSEWIKVFEAEEARVLSDLEAIRRNTSGFRPPAGASQATRDLFHDLARVETEIHRHIHDENFILYPKVGALCRAQDPAAGRGGQGVE